MQNIKEFAEDLTAGINYYMPETGSPTQAFTLYVLKEMQEKAGLGEICQCYDQQKSNRGAIGEINGYAISLNGEKLTLFYTFYNPNIEDGISTISDKYFKLAVNRMKRYFEIAMSGVHYQMTNQHTNQFRLCEYIYRGTTRNNNDQRNNTADKVEINTVQFVVISNGYIPRYEIPDSSMPTRNVGVSVWDIAQLQSNIESESERLNIDIDLVNDPNFRKYQLHYLKMESNQPDFDAYVVLVPGDFLRTAYEVHNIDLLQNNLRYFKGDTKINKGIYKTIQEEPHRFLAYNNGLTAIASEVLLKENEDKVSGLLTRILGLQIVNGGQTTASIYRTKKSNPGVNLAPIYVQMKLIVLKDKEQEFLQKITRFSNSQNKVPDSDYSSNSQFCRDVQKLSESIWTPDVQGNGRRTHWYFIKFTYQYERVKESITNIEQQNAWSRQNPATQKFNKELMSKAYNSWMQLPYTVAKGGQYCFKTFYETFVNGKKEDAIVVNRIFFENLIAQIILFKYLDEESTAFKNYGDHRSQIIPYTIAILSYATKDSFSLFRIWKDQSLAPSLKKFLDVLGGRVREQLLESLPNAKNLRSHCSASSTWDLIKKGVTINEDELLTIDRYKKEPNEDAKRLAELNVKVTDDDYKKVLGYNAKFWYGLSTFDDLFPASSASDNMMKLGQEMVSGKMPNERIVALCLQYLEIFLNSPYTVDEVKSRSNLADTEFDTSIIDNRKRISLIKNTDWKQRIEPLAEIKKIDAKQVKILKKYINATEENRLKFSATDLAIICQVLDKLNASFSLHY